MRRRWSDEGRNRRPNWRDWNPKPGQYRKPPRRDHRSERYAQFYQKSPPISPTYTAESPVYKKEEQGKDEEEPHELVGRVDLTTSWEEEDDEVGDIFQLNSESPLQAAGGPE